MNFDNASKGIGVGLGLIGMGIGLKFMKDVTDDFRSKHKQVKMFNPPSFPSIKKIKWK